MSDINALETILSYTFHDKMIIGRALTHTSVLKPVAGVSGTFERLEFLGDRVLGLVIADRLLEVFPNEKEGAIAKRHASLVCKDRLADVAETVGLGDFIIMSDAEKKSGGRHNETILADCTEAVIGALYKDGGLDAAVRFIHAFWNDFIHSEDTPPIDYKSALQELVQGMGKPPPHYDFIGRTGPDHKPVFTVACRIEGFDVIEGVGDSKKAAEKKAAEGMSAFLINNEGKIK